MTGDTGDFGVFIPPEQAQDIEVNPGVERAAEEHGIDPANEMDGREKDGIDPAAGVGARAGEHDNDPAARVVGAREEHVIDGQSSDGCINPVQATDHT